VKRFGYDFQNLFVDVWFLDGVWNRLMEANIANTWKIERCSVLDQHVSRRNWLETEREARVALNKVYIISLLNIPLKLHETKYSSMLCPNSKTWPLSLSAASLLKLT